jgi:hypothetical protein
MAHPQVALSLLLWSATGDALAVASGEASQLRTTRGGVAHGCVLRLGSRDGHNSSGSRLEAVQLASSAPLGSHLVIPEAAFGLVRWALNYAHFELAKSPSSKGGGVGSTRVCAKVGISRWL